MDGECVSLLPRVCEVLADSDRSLPDDTSLEKLLDWFTEAGPSLLDTCPCLLKFISAVMDNAASDPGVLSFALRLSGLLAADEAGFKTLQECSALDEIFRLQRWKEAGLWEDPCLRIGWVQGLRSMLQHPKALGFLVHSGFIQPLLRLQTDSSLFIASAANQTLAHILLFFQPPRGTEESSEYTAVVTATAEHLRESLVPGDNGQLHRSVQTLRLLALVLGRAEPPLQDRLLGTLAGNLEELVAAARGEVTPAMMDVIASALGSSDPNDGVPHRSVARLLSSMLSPTTRPADLVRASAALLRSGRGDAVNTGRAARILLLPLHVIADQSLLDNADELEDSMVEQLKSKTSCVSIVCVCLTHTPQIALMPTDVLPCPPAVIVRAVLSILRICSGQRSSSSSSTSCPSELLRNITCSGKVQKSALEALVALSGCPGATDTTEEVLTLLLEYLDHPDSDPTVLHKSYAAFLRWMTASSDPPGVSGQLGQDLDRVVRKRVCDPRWEVRDSTVEFLGWQANGRAPLDERRTTPLLREALQDPESYVRASAATALSRTLTTGWQEGAPVSQEQGDVVTRLLEILSEDSEGFARRAVVKFFTAWFSSNAPPAAAPSLLTGSVRGVLARGSADLDWEVKVHTLELAELLLDRALTGHPGYKKATDAAPSHPYAAAAGPGAAPHTHARTPSDGDDGAALSGLAEAGVCSALLSGLVDCDRPVALKACRLLIALRDAVCPSVATATCQVTCEVPGRGWGKEVRRMLGMKLEEEQAADLENGGAGDGGGGARVGVCEALASLGLDERLAVLTRSSDHVHNSLLSLLQDILTAGAAHRRTDAQEGQEEVIVDCY